MMDHAFFRLNSCSTDDMLTDAAVHVLAHKGAVGLSLKAVADWLRVTPSRVSQLTNRDQLMIVVTARFANRWLDWIEPRRWREGALALLPARAEEVAGVRVWLGLCELARERPDLAEFIERVRRRERALLDDLDLDDRQVDLVLATVEGLRVRVCETGGALSVEDARSTLGRLIEVLGAEASRAA